jgi:phospholipid/cholesterol/gamma-HCH transport system permease protein
VEELSLEATSPEALLRQLGRLGRAGHRRGWRWLARPSREGQRVRVDLSGFATLDDTGIATLRVVERRLAAAGYTVERDGAAPALLRRLAETPTVSPATATPVPGLVERLGAATCAGWAGLVALAELSLATLAGSLRAARGRASFSARDVVDQIERMGADSLAIVATLSAVLGLVLAFQTWVQLAEFGTEQFVLEFVGIGMARGFAPFIVGVLLAGRTGSAIAAELATMQMREENDALRVMGLSPVAHLVVPRMLALTVVLPAVNLIATAAGILGGWLVVVSLSSNWTAAWERMVVHLALSDLWLGAVKAVLFGWVIGLSSAFVGFHGGAGPVSIGLAATRAVVASIFFIMIVDAIVTTLWTVAQ